MHESHLNDLSFRLRQRRTGDATLVMQLWAEEVVNRVSRHRQGIHQ